MFLLSRCSTDSWFSYKLSRTKQNAKKLKNLLVLDAFMAVASNMKWTYFECFIIIYRVCVKRKILCKCLLFFLFFCQSYQGLRNCKSVFLILKILQCGGWGSEFSFFQGIHTIIDTTIDICIFVRPVMTTKFGKQVHLQDLA